MTGDMIAILKYYRRTGRFYGREARLTDRLRRRTHQLDDLLALRSAGLLEHSMADRWYLTDSGRDAISAKARRLAE